MISFKVGELFCGPGGLALGLHMAGEHNPYFGRFIPVWANDIDQDACLTYQNNIINRFNPSGKVLCCSVQDLFKNKGILSLSAIDGLTFGFPCNDYSVVGERKGLNGDFGPLYRYGVMALRHFKPLWFIAENVSGIKSANNGNAWDSILKELADPGNVRYRVTPKLVCFEEYGVPQMRHRYIIVGIRSDLPFEFVFPKPSHGPGLTPFVTSLQALEQPKIPCWAGNAERTTHQKKVIEMLKYIKPGDNAWNSDIPEHLRLNVKKAKLSQIYRRLKPDAPAYTLTGSGGGGTHMYHWKEPRALTNRERARIQTFPDDFLFEGKKESVRKQIGMAVPPLGIKAIGIALLETFSQNNSIFKEQ